MLKTKNYKRSTGEGFTLIELLIVIAIIAILAAVAFVALDPLTRFQDARDTSRWSDVTALLSAIKIDQIDNGGSYIWAVSSTSTDTNKMISSATTTSNCDTTCNWATITLGTDCINLSGLVTEGYLASLPISPNGTGTWTTGISGYYMTRTAAGNITVGSCEAENTSSISVSR